LDIQDGDPRRPKIQWVTTNHSNAIARMMSISVIGTPRFLVTGWIRSLSE
jgi:hypothetical protein